MEELTNPDEASLLDKLNVNVKKQALREIYRQSLILDPTVTQAFLSPIKLNDHQDSELQNKLLKGVLSNFPDDFEEILLSTEDGFLLNDQGLVTVGGVSLLKDEIGKIWVLFAAATPIQDQSITDANVDSVLNSLNLTNNFGIWAQLNTGEEDSANELTTALLNGFTTKLEDWSTNAEALAAHLVIQLNAYASHNILANPEKSTTLTKLLLHNMEFNDQHYNSNDKQNLSNALNSYLTKLKAPLRDSLAIQEIENGYKVKVPLKSVTNHSQVELNLLTSEYSVLGKGLQLQATLPGLLPKNSAMKIAKKLNLDDTESSNVHTTPRLNGPWSSHISRHDQNWSSLVYKGFIPYSDPSHFTLTDHIEGFVREVCTSWPKVDQEIMFNLIVERETDV